MKTIFDFDTWQEIYAVLRRNMTRTIITMIGVMWGIFILVALLATAKGFENRFNKNIGDLATNSVFVWGQSTGMAFHGFQEGRPMRLKHSDAMIIEQNVEGIDFVVPRNQGINLYCVSFWMVITVCPEIILNWIKLLKRI